MAELGEPWHDADAEYAALTELLVPAAHGRYEQALDAWDATETKALGFLAIAVAIIAGSRPGRSPGGLILLSVSAAGSIPVIVSRA